MKLTDAVKTIQGIQKKTRQTLGETYQVLQVQEGEDSSLGPQRLRELRGLANNRAALRVQVARALTEHPEVVAALAEYQVALRRQKILRNITPRPWENEQATPETDASAAFDMWLELLGATPNNRVGSRTATTIRRGTPELFATQLVARRDRGQQQVLDAELKLKRLSATVTLTGKGRKHQNLS